MLAGLLASVRAFIAWLVDRVARAYRRLYSYIPSLGQLVKLEARFSNAALIARRGLGPMQALYLLAMVAGLAIALGILFGVFDSITSTLQANNITIDSGFIDSVNTAQSFASIGLFILAAVAVVGLAMFLVRVIGGGGE